LRRLDIVAALILLGLSALVAFETWDLPYWSTFAPGPAFASLWVAAAGALIGAVLLVQALRSGDEPADWPDRTGARQVVLGIAALWLLFASLPFLGTVVGGLVFMLLFLLGIARRPLLPSLAASVLTVALIESVFVLWLDISLPTGVLGF
jgi:putative tricarboxylic transport membrane protein